ncbi:MAG: hypothetical protein J6T23_06065 [Elusimicrobia bacterium]|nr:hypothetical protein [Elusimicrobiota bacterium]
MTKYEYYKKYINQMLEEDFFENKTFGGEYQKAIKFLIEENQNFSNELWKLNEENVKYKLFFKDLKELMED